MIDVPMSVRVAVVLSAVVTCAAGLINGVALKRHLRRHHVSVLCKLGYPPEMVVLVKPENDSEVAAADWALWRFLRRREFKELGDDRLSALATRQLWLIRAGVLLLFVLGVGVFVVQ